jgi:outer membrane receptor for ferric coprogen and ferric-rhodotorulic acid
MSTVITMMKRDRFARLPLVALVALVAFATAATASTTSASTTTASTTTTTTTSTTAGPATADNASPELQEIVVTGSMIKRVNAETAEAITILKTDDLKAQGIENVEQVMNQLTSSNTSVVLTPTCAASAMAAPWCCLMANGWPTMPSTALGST